MNNYQKTKLRNEEVKSTFIERMTHLKDQLAFAKVELDDESKAFLEEYETLFNTAAAKNGNQFTRLFPEIGETCTLERAWNQEGIAIDARQRYQWKKQGYVIEYVGGTGKETTYKYVEYDNETAEATKAKQSAYHKERNAKLKAEKVS